MDTLQVMQSLVAVAETQSFTKAAERLNTTPQVVSKHVKGFEGQYAVRVFDRTTRRVRLTDVGQAVVERCRRILNDFEELEHSVQDKQQMPRGRLRVSAPVSFGELYLVPYLPRVYESFPHMQVSLLLTDRYVNLLEEGVDISIRIGRLEDSTLVAKKIAETRIICVASPSYLQAMGTPSTPEDLHHHRIVHDENLRSGTRWSFWVNGVLRRVAVQPHLSVNGARAVKDLTEAGAGVALLPRFTATSSLRAGRLVQILEPFVGPPTPIHFLFPHAHLLTARVRVFSEHIMQHLNPEDL